MKNIVILAFMTIFLFPSYCLADKILQGGVTEVKELPKGFYGTWNVHSELISSNNPSIFRETSNDIWTFAKEGDLIVLQNPISGATAYITVDEVRNNQAKFRREKKSHKGKEIEQPEITLDGDSFYGTDSLLIEKYKNGETIEKNVVKYRIHGEKISGSKLSEIFKDND